MRIRLPYAHSKKGLDEGPPSGSRTGVRVGIIRRTQDNLSDCEAGEHSVSLSVPQLLVQGWRKQREAEAGYGAQKRHGGQGYRLFRVNFNAR